MLLKRWRGVRMIIERSDRGGCMNRETFIKSHISQIKFLWFFPDFVVWME